VKTLPQRKSKKKVAAKREAKAGAEPEAAKPKHKSAKSKVAKPKAGASAEPAAAKSKAVAAAEREVAGFKYPPPAVIAVTEAKKRALLEAMADMHSSEFGFTSAADAKRKFKAWREKHAQAVTGAVLGSPGSVKANDHILQNIFAGQTQPIVVTSLTPRHLNLLALELTDALTPEGVLSRSGVGTVFNRYADELWRLSNPDERIYFSRAVVGRVIDAVDEGKLSGDSRTVTNFGELAAGAVLMESVRKIASSVSGVTESQANETVSEAVLTIHSMGPKTLYSLVHDVEKLMDAGQDLSEADGRWLLRELKAKLPEPEKPEPPKIPVDDLAHQRAKSRWFAEMRSGKRHPHFGMPRIVRHEEPPLDADETYYVSGKSELVSYKHVGNATAFKMIMAAVGRTARSGDSKARAKHLAEQVKAVNSALKPASERDDDEKPLNVAGAHELMNAIHQYVNGVDYPRELSMVCARTARRGRQLKYKFDMAQRRCDSGEKFLRLGVKDLDEVTIFHAPFEQLMAEIRRHKGEPKTLECERYYYRVNTTLRRADLFELGLRMHRALEAGAPRLRLYEMLASAVLKSAVRQRRRLVGVEHHRKYPQFWPEVGAREPYLLRARDAAERVLEDLPVDPPTHRVMFMRMLASLPTGKEISHALTELKKLRGREGKAALPADLEASMKNIDIAMAIQMMDCLDDKARSELAGELPENFSDLGPELSVQALDVIRPFNRLASEWEFLLLEDGLRARLSGKPGVGVVVPCIFVAEWCNDLADDYTELLALSEPDITFRRLVEHGVRDYTELWGGINDLLSGPHEDSFSWGGEVKRAFQREVSQLRRLSGQGDELAQKILGQVDALGEFKEYCRFLATVFEEVQGLDPQVGFDAFRTYCPAAAFRMRWDRTRDSESEIIMESTSS